MENEYIVNIKAVLDRNAVVFAETPEAAMEKVKAVWEKTMCSARFASVEFSVGES